MLLSEVLAEQQVVTETEAAEIDSDPVDLLL
jgi:hypothetical protein